MPWGMLVKRSTQRPKRNFIGFYVNDGTQHCAYLSAPDLVIPGSPHRNQLAPRRVEQNTSSAGPAVIPSPSSFHFLRPSGLQMECPCCSEVSSPPSISHLGCSHSHSHIHIHSFCLKSSLHLSLALRRHWHWHSGLEKELELELALKLHRLSNPFDDGPRDALLQLRLPCVLQAHKWPQNVHELHHHAARSTHPSRRTPSLSSCPLSFWIVQKVHSSSSCPFSLNLCPSPSPSSSPSSSSSLNIHHRVSLSLRIALHLQPAGGGCCNCCN